MALVKSFKMPFETNHFNANQRVWILFTTGANAAYVTGKYRGKNRYVKAWVKWDSKDKVPPVIEKFEVDDDFANRNDITIYTETATRKEA